MTTPIGYLEEREKERLAAEQHKYNGFQKIYTQPDYLDTLFDSPEGKFAVQYSNEPEEVKKRSANMEYLSWQAGRDIHHSEYPVLRDQYALGKYGAQGINDQQLYDLIAKDFTREKDVQTATTQLYNKAIRKGFEDTLAGKTSSWTDQWETWRQANKDLIAGEDEWPILNQSFRAMQQAQEALGAKGSVAAQTWQTLNKYADGQATEEELQQVGTSLAKTPRDERARIYSMIQSAAATEEDPKDFASFVANLEKSVVRGFGFAEAPGLVGKDENLKYEYLPLPVIERQASVERMRAERMPDGPEKEQALAAANEKIEMTQVVRELKDLANNAINPVAPIFEEKGFFTKRTAEETAYGLAGSIGYLTAAAATGNFAAGISGTLGWLATAGMSSMGGLIAIQHDEYNKFRLKYPDVPPGAAQAFSVAISTPQAVLERIGALTIANKMPVVSTYIKGIEGKLTRRLVAGAAGVATQEFQEFSQNAVSEVGPGLIAALRTDMPHSDWDKVWEDYKDAAPATFFAAAIFGSLSIGTLDISELKSPEQILNDRFLTYMGYNVGQRNEALTARSAQEAQAILRTEYQKRSKSAIAHGIKVMEADMAAAERIQNDPTMPTFSATTAPDGTRLYTVTRPAPQETASVTVVDARTGLETSIEMEAGAAKKEAQRQMNATQSVIDCLLS